MIALIEILVELFLELFAEFIGAAIGIAIATVAYRIWIRGRQRAWDLTTPAIVRAPDGAVHSIEIVGLRPALPLSGRVLGTSGDRPVVSKEHRLHPERLAAAEGCLAVIAPIVLIGVVAVLLFAVVELIVVGVLLGVAVVVRWAFVREWRCVVVTPDGRRCTHRSGGLRAARRRRAELVDAIVRGDSEHVCPGER